MDKIYIDYENTDLLDMPIDDSNYTECKLIGHIEVPGVITERSKVALGDLKVKPKGHHEFWLYVGGEEGIVPHMHISRKKIKGNDQQAWDEAIVLEILRNHYFIHSKIWKNKSKDEWPKFESKKEFDAIIKLLKSKYTGKHPYRPNLTVWEHACYAWNDENDDYPISQKQFEKGIPEYDYDTITNYNEKE